MLWILAVMFKTAKAPFPRVILSEGRNTVQTEVETRRATTKWSDLAAIRWRISLFLRHNLFFREIQTALPFALRVSTMDIRPSLKMTVAGRCFVSLPLGEGGSADCAETDEVFHAFLDLPHPPQAVPLPRGEGTDKHPFIHCKASNHHFLWRTEIIGW